MKQRHIAFSTVFLLGICSVLYSETYRETQLIESFIKETATSEIEFTKPNRAASLFKNISSMELRDSSDQTMIFVATGTIAKPFSEIRIEYNEISGGVRNNWAFSFLIAKMENETPDLLGYVAKQYTVLLKKKGIKNILDDETNFSWNLAGNFTLVVSESKKSPQLITIQISKKENED